MIFSAPELFLSGALRVAAPARAGRGNNERPADHSPSAGADRRRRQPCSRWQKSPNQSKQPDEVCPAQNGINLRRGRDSRIFTNWLSSECDITRYTTGGCYPINLNIPIFSPCTHLTHLTHLC